ncbi:MAG TPA: hypothetical protein VF150_11975, partial [Thermoanaerobaculia bacterium]
MAQGHSKVSSEVDHRAGSFGWRVLWIDWDSGLRGGGLRVGDRVTGDQGGPYGSEEAERRSGLGDMSESRRFEAQGLAAGDPVTLTVERTDPLGRVVETASVSGTLTENRSYRDAEGRRSYGEDGPPEGEKDGFPYAWRPWYQQLEQLGRTVLMGWDRTVGYDTRRLAAELETFRERVAFLGERYPGRFARAVQEDFQAMERMLSGEPRELSPEALSYRQLGDVRAAEITQAADRAYEVFLAELAGEGHEVIEAPFPVPDAFEEDVSAFVGKVVRLPEIGDREILFETQRSWYRFGRSQGLYVIERQAEATQGLFVATDEYIEKVDPNLKSRRLAFTGVVLPQPALVTDLKYHQTVVALRVRPLGVLVTNHERPEHRFFVDLRPEKTGGAFAGEEGILATGRPRLAPELSPREVMEVFFECLKLGDFDTWRDCFAGWKVRSHYEREGSWLYVDRTWKTVGEQEAVSLWDNSRRELLADVYGLEVAHVGEPEVVYDAAEQPAGKVDEDPEPRLVERVRVVVDHVGRPGEG